MALKSLRWSSSAREASEGAVQREPRSYGGAIIHEVNVTDRELRQPPRGTLADLPSLNECNKKTKK